MGFPDKVIPGFLIQYQPLNSQCYSGIDGHIVATLYLPFNATGCDCSIHQIPEIYIEVHFYKKNFRITNKIHTTLSFLGTIYIEPQEELMIQLYTALIHANVPENDAKNVLTELENTIHTEVEKGFLEMNLTTIIPVVREQDGIRNEILRLNDKIDITEERLTTKIDTVEERLNTKIDAVEERLNTKIDAVEERLIIRIDAVEKRLEAKIETVNTKIDFVEAKMDSKFQFHDKLLWTIISLLVALFGFVVTNSILIYQKLK